MFRYVCLYLVYVDTFGHMYIIWIGVYIFGYICIYLAIMCLVTQSCPTLCDCINSSPQPPPSMGFFKK